MRRTQRGASLGLMLFGLLFFGVGLIVILFLPIRGEVFCGGEPPVCAIERGGLITAEIRQFAAADIADAIVEEYEDEEGSMLYRPVFVLRTGAIEPLQGGFSNLGDPSRDVAQVRAWLAAPTTTLALSSSSAWFAFVFGGIFALVGATIMGVGWVQGRDG